MYKKTYREEWKKAMYVCSHTFCASFSGSRVGGGLHQWVCSPAGQTVGGHEWVEMKEVKTRMKCV